MWCCDIIKWIFLASCIFLPILWIYSKAFRFYTRITAYYICIFIAGQLPVFFVLPKFGDPLNYKLVHKIFLALTSWVNIKYRLEGGQHLKLDKPFVVVCNHQSSLDLYGMASLWPERCVPMMKSSMQYLGLLGVTAKASGSIFIERYNKESAIATVNKAAKKIKDSQCKIWVFPEGTRNHGEGLLAFKKGPFHLAIQLKIPIVPFVFSSYKCFYDPKEYKFSNEGFVLAEALSPIDTTNLTCDDVAKLCDETREKMLHVLERNSPEAARIFENHSF